MFIFSVGLTYKTIIFTSTSDQKLYGIIAITLLPLLIYIFIIFLVDYRPLFTNITSIIVVFEPIIYAYLVSAIFLYLISNTSRKVTPNSSIFEFLKGYIDSWVLDEPNRLENLLSDNSIDITVDTYLLTLPDTKWRPTYLIIPYFHFGPFRNIGSSRFPSIISEYLYLRKGVNSMIFHTPTSHDLDLSSHKETKQAIEQVIELSEPIICTGISNIHTIQVDDVRVYTIKLNNSIVVILESSEMEDLPLDLAKKIVEYGKRLGYKEVIVIDAHNSLRSIKYQIPERTLASMLSASKRALRDSLDKDIYSFKAGFIKINIPTFTRRKGLGEAGISILIWETLTELNTIINIDSNNLSTQLREDIIKLVKSKFNSRVVVTTTDTHEVTAIPLNERGYALLGEKDQGKKLILTSISKAIGRALNELKETDIIIYHKKVKTKVLGMDTIEKMGIMLNKAYNMMMKGLLYIIIPSTILHILLIYILGLI